MNRIKGYILKFLYEYGNFIPDSVYLRCLFFLKMGKRLNLKNPETFCEKLQWLKLYDRKPEYTRMVDKLAVKDYVSEIIGDEYVIPTLGAWEKPEDIEWDKLPQKFVLKTTHGGGSTGVVICKDKTTLNKNQAIIRLKQSMKQDIYRVLREWPYKNVPRRIIAEKYISSKDKPDDLPDYKFFCFNGEPKYCQVISGRETDERIDFFDYEWNHQPFHEPKKYAFADLEPQRPTNLNKMWELAKQLSKGLSFARIDFYEVDQILYFGEITFFPTSGMGDFEPKEWDYLFGSWIKLPLKNKKL